MYSFEYECPDTIDQAVEAITDDGHFLAGGQSLIQVMKLRLSMTDKLVDLRNIPELQGISFDGNAIVIGAMTAHAAVAQSELVYKKLPAIADLASGIGDPMVRNMGTIGGSLANADPAACYPAGLLGLGGVVHTNKRDISADDFFIELYETALEPNEIIVSVRLPVPLKAAYVKFKQPASRFALVGVFVAQFPNEVRVAVTGACSKVFRLSAVEEALRSNFSDDAAKHAVVDTSYLNSDMHASADYRAHLVEVMTRRAIQKVISFSDDR